MVQATAIRLTGEDLRIDDVWAVALGAADAALSDDARTKMRAARELVERAAHGTREHTYGINTGFGRFVSKSIPEEQTEELQLRLLRSHACGVGEPYPDEIVRAAMLLRANALAKGNSGARVETVELLLECLRHGVLPHVPSRGSVGASGDLAPLAHLALPLVGEGEAWVDETRLDGAAALAAVGLEPIELEAKEGLSLVNGTQFMAAFGSLALARARRLAKTAELAYVEATVSVELNAATDNPLVLVEDELLVSNGNFHGQPLAFALDALAMAVSELANISERRLERLVNPSLSDGLPPFLTNDGGLNSGFMIPQYVAAALVSENKALCHPASVDSIPTSAGQEDHVSMGNAAGLKAWQVLANAERALAIELLAGAQAIEFFAPLEPGLGARAARDAVRALSPRLSDDRSLAGEIELVAQAIRDGGFVAAVEADVGELR